MSRRTLSGSRYQILGLTNAASQSEIRRAYRILARRYHPDLNPNTDTAKIFREIAEAYAILSDPEKRRLYDVEIDQLNSTFFEESFLKAEEALKRKQGESAYKRATHQDQRSDVASNNQSDETTKVNSPTPTPKANSYNLSTLAVKLKKKLTAPELTSKFRQALNLIKTLEKKVSVLKKTPKAPEGTVAVSSFSLVEISVSMHDALHGAKRTVEIADQPNNIRKLSVNIPPGVTTGSIVRLRNKSREGEEIALIIKVERHPWLSISERGLTMEIGLTINEALEGAKIQVPSFGDPLLVTVEAGTKSGKEVRLKNQGIPLKDGLRGDLYLRFIVCTPDNLAQDNLNKLREALRGAYVTEVRSHLPKRLDSHR
jgi:curved DNA-binding protein